MSVSASDTPSPARRLLLLVGQSEFLTTALGGLGVPTPEAPPGLHHRLLRQASVVPGDARPQAWLAVAEAGYDAETREQVRDWIESHCGAGDTLLTDPHLAWFVGLWQSVAARVGVEVAVVNVPGPPTGDGAAAAAAWLNEVLHVERATRSLRRVYVDAGSLAADWTGAVFRIGQVLGIAEVLEAGAAALRQAHHDVRDLTLPAEPPRPAGALGELIDEAASALSALTSSDGPPLHHRLDELRAAYTSLYRQAEEMTTSTLTAQRSAERHERRRARRARRKGRG